MFRHELAIEQSISSNPHPGHKPGHRHLGSIGHARKHALAEKGLPHRQAIEPSDHLAVEPAFHTVRQTHCVET
jgi:hypothetical protein